MLTTNRVLSASTRSLRCAVLALCVLCQLSLATVGQQPGDKLAKVEFEGAKRLSQEQLMTASGLEIGKPLDVAALDAAGQRLMDSGLLKKLSYRLHTNNNQAEVIFQIEEAADIRHPVIFDNFIWFSDEDLAIAARHDVPSFDGTALDAGNMTDQIAHGLQLLLDEHKIAGKVEYLPMMYEGSSRIDHVFSVRGLPMPVCTVHFSGTANVSEERLQKAAKDLLGKSYSRTGTSTFAGIALFPIYRELGQLRAQFGRPLAKPLTTEKCRDGVDLTIPVNEGVVYAWEGAEWSGNHVVPAAELDKALQMKAGEVANGLKLDKGVQAAAKVYGRQGYIDVGLKPTAVYDDDAHKVAYRIEVKEGVQYRMGSFFVKGLPDNQTNYLRGKWEMLKGDVYDSGYTENFFKVTLRESFGKFLAERKAAGKPELVITTTIRPNKTDLTVDVILQFADKKEE